MTGSVTTLRKQLNRAERGHALSAYFIVLLACGIVLWLCRPEPVPAELHGLGLAALAVALFPFYQWYAGDRRRMPMFELICLSYAVQYVTPLYLQPNVYHIRSQNVLLNWDSVQCAIEWVLLGLSSMVLGFLVLKKVWSSQRLPTLDIPLERQKIFPCAVVAFLIGITYSLLESLGMLSDVFKAFTFVARALRSQLLVGIAILTWLIYRRPELQKYRLLLFVSVVFSVTVGLRSGMLELGLLPLAAYTIAIWYARRRMPIGLLLLGVLLFVSLNAVKPKQRTIGASGWLESGWSYYISLGDKNDVASVDSGLRGAVSRLDFLHPLAYVTSVVPDQKPRYGGATYEFLWSGWIPRFLWPDKPSANDANARYAVDFGILSPKQTRNVTMGVGHLTEAYLNFGFLGFVIVMVLHGVFYGTLDGLFNGPLSQGGRVAYLAIMIQFLNGIGSATGQFLYTGVIDTLITTGVVWWLAGHKRGLPVPRVAQVQNRVGMSRRA